MSEMNGAQGNNSAGEDRQFLHFSFYKLDRGFRRLPEPEHDAALAEFAAIVDEYGGRFPIRAHTMFGIRPDADFMLRKVSELPWDVQELATALHASAAGPHPE